MPYVYILKCRDDTYYTGYTVEVDRRLQEHQNGLASKYTRGRTRWNWFMWKNCRPRVLPCSGKELKRLTRANKQKVIESARQSQ